MESIGDLAEVDAIGAGMGGRRNSDEDATTSEGGVDGVVVLFFLPLSILSCFCAGEASSGWCRHTCASLFGQATSKSFLLSGVEWTVALMVEAKPGRGCSTAGRVNAWVATKTPKSEGMMMPHPLTHEYFKCT